MGHAPQAAFLSYSNFGNPPDEWLENPHLAVSIRDSRGVEFEYDADVTLNADSGGNIPSIG